MSVEMRAEPECILYQSGKVEQESIFDHEALVSNELEALEREHLWGIQLYHMSPSI